LKGRENQEERYTKLEMDSWRREGPWFRRERGGVLEGFGFKKGRRTHLEGKDQTFISPRAVEHWSRGFVHAGVLGGGIFGRLEIEMPTY